MAEGKFTIVVLLPVCIDGRSQLLIRWSIAHPDRLAVLGHQLYLRSAIRPG